MFDPQTQARFNQSCTEAFVNYLNASGAAYQAVAQQMLQAWGQSVDAMMEASKVPGGMASHRMPAASSGGAAACMMPWAAVPNAMTSVNPMASLTPFGMPYGMFSPFAPWLEMMKPAQANAWPMAVGMISFGVPQQVAWPAAKANMAALDAFQVAANSVEKALADYKSSATPEPRGRVERLERRGESPASLAFTVMPFNPTFLMDFFNPYRAR